MAAPTDLTWAQLNGVITDNNGSPLTFITSTEPDAEGFSVIGVDLSALVGYPITSMQNKGVIKALARLLEIARAAQEKLNEGKPAGEKLAALPAPTVGPTINGYAPVTRSLASRHELSTTTSIVGAIA